MDETNQPKVHDEYASIYDSKVREYDSHTHEVLFGMCYEYIKPGDSLLDLGIGTGLSSVLFAKAGLYITGLDESLEMLKECQKKGFVKEIKQYDVQDVPLPYLDNAFSHVICCGVFHFFADLQPTIKEVCRILKPAGIFAFTIASPTAEEVGSDCESTPDYIEIKSPWGPSIFKHSDEYVSNITEKCGLATRKQQKILEYSGDKDIGDILFKVIVVQKQPLRNRMQ